LYEGRSATEDKLRHKKGSILEQYLTQGRGSSCLRSFHYWCLSYSYVRKYGSEHNGFGLFFSSI